MTMTRNKKEPKATRKNRCGEYVRIPKFKMSAELRNYLSEASKSQGISAGSAFLDLVLLSIKGR